MIQCERLLIDRLPAELVTSLDRHSLFSSPAFAGLWQELEGTVVVWTVREDREIVAALTGVEFGRSLLSRFQAMPDGLYGRVYALGQPQTKIAAQVIPDAVSSHRYARAFIVDFDQVCTVSDRLCRQELRTMVVDIHPLYEPPDATLRSEIRKAERDMTSFRPIDWRIDREPFLYLMEHTEHRHGRNPKYPAEFYDALAELADKDKRVEWFICYVNDRAAASHIFLIDSPMALHWQVYFDKSASPAKPNQLILYTMARGLAEQGITTLNLGSSPPEAESLIAYKQKWGAREYVYPQYVRTSLLGRLA